VWLRETIIERAGGKHDFRRQCVAGQLDRVRAELEGPDPSPIERLLAERASLCWFLVNWYETAYVRCRTGTFKEGDYHEKMIDRANRRFLSAVKTLAQVRKLALPNLQVNIGRNQVIAQVGAGRNVSQTGTERL
jgi:hypothetical protein